MNERIAIIGLGYVGLPVALAFAARYPDTVGFDINKARIEELRSGKDNTGEVEGEVFANTSIHFTSKASDLKGCTVFIVSVPTPIDDFNTPDLTPLESACTTIAPYVTKGSVVVFESTVYPGVTEEICGPILAKGSGLTQGKDFTLGYSPERINPGDKEHRLETITKVVSGQDKETLSRLSALYGSIIPAGIHEAPSIKVAEAAKVIENTQRDLNIALMNELALIFDRMDIATSDVLAAAGTKWNFLPFKPGLVGGHCIGVDPYYLTTKAEAVGYHPQVILAGRRINDQMGSFVARKVIKLLIESGKRVRDAKIGVLGLSFKENVPDIRNSRVPDILRELAEFGVTPIIHDPLADKDEVKQEYGVDLGSLEQFTGLDVLVLAVPHQEYLDGACRDVIDAMHSPKIVVDVKAALSQGVVGDDGLYWAL